MSTHRTQGETRNCKGCRYWSEMIARTSAGGVQAMCLAPKDSAMSGRYTLGHQSCGDWASGHLGAIDDPGSDGTEYAQEPPTEGAKSNG